MLPQEAGHNYAINVNQTDRRPHAFGPSHSKVLLLGFAEGYDSSREPRGWILPDCRPLSGPGSNAVIFRSIKSHSPRFLLPSNEATMVKFQGPQISSPFRNVSLRSALGRTPSTSTASTVRCEESIPQAGPTFGKKSVKRAVLDALTTTTAVLDGLSEVIPVPGIKSVTSSMLTLVGLYQKYEDNAEHFEDFIQSAIRFEKLIWPYIQPENDRIMSADIRDRLNRLSNDLNVYQAEVQRRIEDYKSLFARIKRVLFIQEDARLLVEMTTKLKDGFQAVVVNVTLDTNLKIQKTCDDVDMLTSNVLLPAYPYARHDSGDRPQCLKGTRTRILGHIEKWAESESAHQIYWLTGSSGTGKSTIACTIAHRLCDELTPYLASFFCSRETDLRRLVPTFAVQMRGRIKEFRPFLSCVMGKDEGIGHRSICEQLQKLLVEPFQTLFSHRHQPVILVIDGLDESPMEDGVDRALRFLEALVKLLPQAPYMRVFISSQPIPQWKDFLSSHCLSVDLDDYLGPEVQKDIHAYFESLQNDTYKKDEEVVATIPLIASQANGSFIYARTMFKLLEQSREDYLQSVNSAKEITGQDALSKVYSHLVDKALRSVATPSLRVQLYDAVLAMTCLRSALSLAEVCTLLDIGSKAGHLDRFLQEFSSVLHSGPDKQMHFVHNSFKDFLQERVSSPDTGPATLARPSPHHMIASRLLRLMMENLNRSSRDAISGALEYACLYWLHHLESGARGLRHDGPCLGELQDALSVFMNSEVFLFWIEFLVSESYLESIEETLSVLQKWISQNVKPSLTKSCNDLSALIRDMTIAIRTCWPALRESPQQAYHTLLFPGSPAQARIAARYKHLKPSVTAVHTHWQGQKIMAGLTSVDVLVLSPDGDYVVTGGSDGSIRIWSTYSAELVGETKPREHFAVHNVAFIDSRKFIVVVADMTHRCVDVAAWDFTSGALVCQKKLLHTEFHDGDLHNGMKVILSASLKYAAIAVCRVFIWECASLAEIDFPYIRTPKLLAFSSECFITERHAKGLKDGLTIHDLVVESDALSCASFTRDERLLAVGTLRGAIRLYDAVTFCIQASIPAKTSMTHPSCITFSPNGSFLSSLNPSCIYIWETSTQKRVTKLLSRNQTNDIKFSKSPKGNRFRIASACDDGTISCMGWFTARNSVDSQVITALAYSPDGCHVAYGFRNGAVEIYDAADYRHQRPLAHTLTTKAKVAHLVFSPNGKYLAITSDDGGLILRSLPLSPASEHWNIGNSDTPRQTIKCTAFSGDSKFLAVGYIDTMGCLQVERFDVETRAVSGAIKFAPRTSSRTDNPKILPLTDLSLALSEDGSLCAIGGRNFLLLDYLGHGPVKGSGKVPRRLQYISTAVRAQCLFFTKNGRHIVSTAGTFEFSKGTLVRTRDVTGIHFPQCHLQEGWIVDQGGRRRCWIPEAERYDCFPSFCSEITLRDRTTGNMVVLRIDCVSEEPN